VYLIIPIFLVFLIYVAVLVKKSYLSLKYSYLWIAFFVVSLMPVFFGDFIDQTLVAMGFEIPTNGIIVLSIAFLSFVCLNISIQLTTLEKQLENLVTKIAVNQASRPSNDS
jgi:hypothetical protein